MCTILACWACHLLQHLFWLIPVLILARPYNLNCCGGICCLLPEWQAFERQLHCA
jgi:hypothetical protein